MIKRKLLVLATARSGTKFAAMLYTDAGLKIGHERVKEDGTSSSFFAVDDETYPRVAKDVIAHEGERLRQFEFDTILHQVRDPRKVIASAAKIINEENWEWISKFVDIDPALPKMIRCGQYWVKWNELIDRKHLFKLHPRMQGPDLTATMRYRVEDLPNQWHHIREMLGVTCELPDTNTHAHAATGFRTPEVLSWADIETRCGKFTSRRVFDLARHYGYDVDLRRSQQ